MAHGVEEVLVASGAFLESEGDRDFWFVAGLRDVSNDAGAGCDIGWGVVFAASAGVFAEADIEDPVQVAVIASVGADGVQGGFRIELARRQVKAPGRGACPTQACRNHHHHKITQPMPHIPSPWVFQTAKNPIKFQHDNGLPKDRVARIPLRPKRKIIPYAFPQTLWGGGSARCRNGSCATAPRHTVWRYKSKSTSEIVRATRAYSAAFTAVKVRCISGPSASFRKSEFWAATMADRQSTGIAMVSFA